MNAILLTLLLSKLLLVSLSSLLNTPRKMHKSKLSQNFYSIGRNNEQKSISAQIHNYKFFATSVVQGLAGGIVSGDESNAYTLVNIRAANATRKPDTVLVTPESFSGYADYLYDDSSSSQYNINIHLKHATGVFTGGNVRFSVLCIWT